MRNCQRGNCHCQRPNKQIVYPTQENTVHCCSEEVIEHIHPSNTNVVNHHLIKNVHEYPHSTTFTNTVNSVDVLGTASQAPTPLSLNPGVDNMNQPGASTPPSGSQDPNFTEPTNIQPGFMPFPPQQCCPPFPPFYRPRRW